MPHATTPEQARLDLIERLGQVYLDTDVHTEGREYAAPDPYTPTTKPPMSRHTLLARLHALLAPRTYFEIGVNTGSSLALSKTPTVAVDPFPVIDRPIICDYRLFEETSDVFFERPEGLEHFGGIPIDLSFIDGMHLSEFTLRDFMNTEKHSKPGTVIVLDDVLPRNSLEAYRIRRTGAWAGDVYKVSEALREYRPDLVQVLLNTAPTGTLLVTNLDPSSTVLEENYSEIEKSLVTSDPQLVPDELLSWGGWGRVVELRNRGASREEYAQLFEDLARLPRLGDLGAQLVSAQARAEAEVAAANGRASEAARRADAVRGDLVGLLERLNRSPAGIVLRRVDRWKVLCNRYHVS